MQLTSYPQWVAWKYDHNSKRRKKPKMPINPSTGKAADTTDASTWGTYEEARSWSQRYRLDGVGFVLTALDPFSGGDLDNCRNPETGEIDPWALDVIRRLNTYTEISPSGTGVRFFVIGKLPPAGRKKGNIEVYESGRFLTITGNRLEGTPCEIQERQEELTEWHTEVWGLNHRFSLVQKELQGKHANTSAVVLAWNPTPEELKSRFHELNWRYPLVYAALMRDCDVQCAIVAHLGRDSALVDQAFAHVNGVSLRFACVHEETRPDRPSADLSRSLTDPETIKFRCHHRGEDGLRSRQIGLVDWYAWQTIGEYHDLTKAELKLWTVRLFIDMGLIDAPDVARRSLPDELVGAPEGLRVVYHGIVERMRVQAVIGSGYVPLAHKYLAYWCGVTEYTAAQCMKWLLKHYYLTGGVFLRKDGTVGEKRESERAPECFVMNLTGKPAKPTSKTYVRMTPAEWKKFYAEKAGFDDEARDALFMEELTRATTKASN